MRVSTSPMQRSSFTHANEGSCRTSDQFPGLLSERTPGIGFLVRVVLSSSEVTGAEAEAFRRFLTAVRVQARAAATCRAVVNGDPSQMFVGSGDDVRVSSVLFETRAA
jgi:hypothetical protein